MCVYVCVCVSRRFLSYRLTYDAEIWTPYYIFKYAGSIFLVFFYAHFTLILAHVQFFNFLTEPDTDILIENKNVPYGRFSSNIVKELYRVSENSELQVHFNI